MTGATLARKQGLPELLASLSALTSVELNFEQVPETLVPTPCEMTPLQQGAFQLQGLRPHPESRQSLPEAMSAARSF